MRSDDFIAELCHRRDKAIIDETQWNCSAEDFLKARARYMKSFENVYLGYANLASSTNCGCSFKNARLGGANFQDAVLAEARFTGAFCGGTNFRGADLSEANFTGTELNDADFRGAKIDGTDFDGAKIDGARGLVSAGGVGVHRRTIYAVDHGTKIYFQAGCFFGSHDELVEAVNRKYHPRPYHLKAYLSAIAHCVAAIEAQREAEYSK